MPKVSVIINCYNGENFIKQAIDSVYSQTFEDWEIVFWDNCSSDQSLQIARAYDSKLHIFASPKHTSLGEARNNALKKCRGKFIAFLDCDDSWLPQKLEKQLPLFNDPNIGLVYSDVIYFNSKGNSFKLYDQYKFYIGNCFSSLFVNYFLSLPTVIIRKKILNQLDHFFDKDLNICEEMDLFLRISYISQISFVNEPLARYFVRPDNITNTKFYLIEKEINLIIDKFMRIYPKFNIQYGNEITALKLRHAFSVAKRLCIENKPKAARKKLRPFMHSYRVKVLFFVSYFPSFFLKFINNLRSLTP